jgi:hypothetical protein
VTGAHIRRTANASYSGTTAPGVPILTDGARPDHIHLQGDYTAQTFIVSGDGSGARWSSARRQSPPRWPRPPASPKCASGPK